MSGRGSISDRVLHEVDEARDELVELAASLVRVPTVNPPGERYRECADLLGRRLAEYGFAVELLQSEPEPDPLHPRWNVLGARRGAAERPLVHLNGHLDVVPAGDGWTVDPFGGETKEGRLYGRGSADMKAGLAAAVIAAEALRRAGASLAGTIEVSGTADEESGGFAGVGWLAETGRISATRTDHVIIPEPLGVDRVCIGHRGVYWCRVRAHGKIAHGSMPFLGSSAVDPLGRLLERVRTELRPALAKRRTEMPVVPDEARWATINVNAVAAGQAGMTPQTPCVADLAEAIFDRRFLYEEGFEAARQEILDLVAAIAVENAGWKLEVEDLMVVHPTRTPAGDPLVMALEDGILEVLGHEATIVASPGTYDHKHVTRIGGVESCVAYGPGVLEQAHQPDEWCAIQDMVDSAKVMALALLRLGVGR
ncbi:MAG TPA: acetylornithine deacetylase/succinyl-diaminopimelate desuccinylase family protein [Thermoanaerobaculia bacterium]|nr:acetylornithine deacetylase/succinyl-diaminopimelate desuccinylase family protein [Thermoanaerobaculia bacterium]